MSLLVDVFHVYNYYYASPDEATEEAKLDRLLNIIKKIDIYVKLLFHIECMTFWRKRLKLLFMGAFRNTNNFQFNM